MPRSQPQLEVLIVTGMSGAGRSTVADALEDLGWYVVDNLPLQLLETLTDLATKSAGAIERIAAVVDVRGRNLFADVQATVAKLRKKASVRIVFLEATNEALVRRYESVRRPHPLQGDGSLLDGINTERTRLEELREHSDVVIDTSTFNVHQLASSTRELFASEGTEELSLTIQSFGFKYGIPTDVDMVADMRFLPNPFWNAELRHLDGTDERVSSFVLDQEGAEEFLHDFVAALKTQLAGFIRENKRHATLAVGCTGGKHRSVTMARAIAAELESLPGVRVTMKHRDLGRE